MAVNPIPEGHSTLIPHLTVSDAAKAIDFYKAAFGAEELSRALGPGGKVVHAELKIGDSRLFLNDQFGPPEGEPASVAIHMWSADANAAWDRATKAGATVKMPLMDAFWGDRYGQLKDPFGHTWSISQHVEDVSPEDMQTRMVEAFKNMPGSPAS